MISKKIRCNSIQAAISYVLVGRGARVIDGSLEMAELIHPKIWTPKIATQIAERLQTNDYLRPEVPAKWRHWSLAIEPGRYLSGEDWRYVTAEFFKAHGLDPTEHMYLVAEHEDKGHDHVHIIWSRISAGGTLARDHFRDCEISRSVCRNMEKELGLQPVPEPSVSKVPVPGRSKPRIKSATRPDQEITARGEVPRRRIAAELIRSVWPGAGERLPFRELSSRFSQAGIEIGLTRKGLTVGVAYTIDGQTWKASNLGKEFQWAGLSAHILPELQQEDASAVNPVPRTGSRKPTSLPLPDLRNVTPESTTPPTRMFTLPRFLEASHDSTHSREEARRRKFEPRISLPTRPRPPRSRALPRPGSRRS